MRLMVRFRSLPAVVAACLFVPATAAVSFGHGVEYQLTFDPVGGKIQTRQIVSTDTRPVTLTDLTRIYVMPFEVADSTTPPPPPGGSSGLVQQARHHRIPVGQRPLLPVGRDVAHRRPTRWHELVVEGFVVAAQPRRHGVHLPVHRSRAQVGRLAVHRGGSGGDATPGLSRRCHHGANRAGHDRQRVIARLFGGQCGDAEYKPSLKRGLPAHR